MTSQRFCCEESRYLLPTFRRPNYVDLVKASEEENESELLSPDEAFFEWSRHDGQYQLLTNGLMNDDSTALRICKTLLLSLKRAIKQAPLPSVPAMYLYRGVNIDDHTVEGEYHEGVQFLWPAVTATSRNIDVARKFGSWVFAINVSRRVGVTYFADVAAFSNYPEEQEVLFYPYSGFTVGRVDSTARIIELVPTDTLQIEAISRRAIPSEVTIYDKGRDLYVHIRKGSTDLQWSTGTNPTRYLIAQNMYGYWDAPYRFHHLQGYFVNRHHGIWEEWQHGEFYCRFEVR
jgi:hypothetical protein